VRAGQEVRLLDLPVGDRQFGVFDTVNGFGSGQAFADHLKVAAGRCYGVAGREFVQKLASDDPSFSKIQKAFEVYRPLLIAKLAIGGASSEVSRAATKFALVAFAGELATAYGLTGWEKGDAEDAARELFSEWLSGRGSIDGADDEAIVRQVRLFIEQHGESRFCRLVQRPAQADDEANDRANDRAIINRAGFFDGETYFFSREVFKTEVCRGFDPVHAANALKRRKCLETNHGLQFKRRDPDSGRTIPFYAVSSVIFE
jgi:putative DNA primase/helicase